MEPVLQSSLFNHTDRRDLGNGAWLEVRCGWLQQGGSRDDSLFGELRDSISWRAERRQMYDRVLDVPRLVSFHDLADQVAAPPHPASRNLGDGSTTHMPASWENRS